MSIYSKTYERINWKNFPSRNTALDEINLNKMDKAIDEIDNRVVSLSGYEDIAKGYRDEAKSYAVGTNGEVREGDATDNAKYYSEVANLKSNETKGYRDEAVSASESAIASARQALISETNAKNSEDNVTQIAQSIASDKEEIEQAKADTLQAKSDAENAKADAESASASAKSDAESVATAKDDVSKLKNDAVTIKGEIESLKSATETASQSASESASNASQSAEEAKEYAQQASRGVTKDAIETALGYTPASEDDIPTVPTDVSAFNNDVGYLTEHQDISGKVDKEEGKSLIADTEIERLAEVHNYELPTASTDTLGGVKVGNNLTVDENGVLSAVGGGGSGDSKVFVNLEVLTTDFVADETYEKYPFKAEIELEGVSASWIPSVSFNVAEATSGNYSPVADCGNNSLIIFAKKVPSEDFEIASVVCNKLIGTATIVVTTADFDGEEVTLTGNGIEQTKTFVDGTASFEVGDLGTYTVSCSGKAKEVEVKSFKAYSVEINDLTIVSFADGTDEQISAMIEAHYNGDINISDYWNVGDTRTIHLNAMGNSGILNSNIVVETHSAQDVEMVIIDFDHDDLVTPINGHTKTAITVNQIKCLKLETNSSFMVQNAVYDTSLGSMNNYTGSHTNAGGWESCSRRTWCNNAYKNALPTAIKNAVKTVKKLTSEGSRSSTIKTTNDDVFLLSEIEIFGSTTYSFAGEGSQYKYFQLNTANRYKMPKWSSDDQNSTAWMERSPCSSNLTDFCFVNTIGDASIVNSGTARSIAPCICL